MAWGYWICNSFANVGYAVLLMDSLNYFFPPYFKGGNNWLSIACGSIVLWIIFFIVLAGVKQASALNVIGTIGKLLPLAIFLLVLLFSFRFSTFFTDFWGLKTVAKVHDTNLGGILPQVKSTMLVTLWVFTGIEGAVVVSGRAKSQKDVSKATFLGFITCLLIYTLLSLLPLGVYSQGEISKMAPPSTVCSINGFNRKLGKYYNEPWCNYSNIKFLAYLDCNAFRVTFSLRPKVEHFQKYLLKKIKMNHLHFLY